MNIEQEFVHNVYSQIYTEFNKSRYSVWNFVENFLNDKSELLGLDVGCGNGKNMIHENMIGIDMCKMFVSMCKDKHKNVLHASCLQLPFACNIFDYVISISVIHHLSSIDRQVESINEIVRVLKPGGYGLINVWSLENQSHSKRSFKHGDNFISWKTKQNKVFYRYYFVHDHRSISQIVHSIDNISDIVIKNEMGNWVVYFKKTT
jgi:ubiquinone/menaquinone biosynthesis C-methylase UbiE